MDELAGMDLEDLAASLLLWLWGGEEELDDALAAGEEQTEWPVSEEEMQ